MKKTISILVLFALLFSLAFAGMATAYAAEAAIEDAISTRDEHEYVSELLGIRAVFDEDWRLLSEEEIADVMGYVAAGYADETLAEILRDSSAVCDLYAVWQDGSGDNVNLQLEDLGALYGLTMGEEAYLKVALPRLEQGLTQMGVEHLETVQEEYYFAGRNRFSVLLVGESGGVAFTERIVVMKGGRYMASLSVFSTEAQRIDDILAFFEPLELDAEEALGSKQGNTYRSELLGVEAVFADNWHILSPEETAQVMGYMADGMDDEALAELLRSSGSTCDLYVICMDQSGQNLNIQLEDLGTLYGVILSEAKYAELALPQLESAFGQIGFQNVKLTTGDYVFAGRTHVSVLVSAEVNGTPVYERLVLVKAGHFMATVTAFAMQQEQLDTILAQFHAA